MNEKNVFNESHHCFRCERSCLSQILLLEQFDTILLRLDNEANADVMYLDLTKAFDKVYHVILLKKMKKLGINESLYLWLESFLTNWFKFVNRVTSELQTVISGVPHRNVLGPLILFSF